MSADWFQGAYLFSLYHDEFNLDIKTIAILFVLGFLAAAVSGKLAYNPDLRPRVSATLLDVRKLISSCFQLPLLDNGPISTEGNDSVYSSHSSVPRSASLAT